MDRRELGMYRKGRSFALRVRESQSDIYKGVDGGDCCTSFFSIGLLWKIGCRVFGLRGFVCGGMDGWMYEL